MRLPWARRRAVEDRVRSVIPRYGAATTEVAHAAGFSVARTHQALTRLAAAGRVRAVDSGPTDRPSFLMTIWHAVDEPGADR